jgi:hypothetical protein
MLYLERTKVFYKEVYLFNWFSQLPEELAFSTKVGSFFQMQIALYWINLDQKQKQI